MVVAVVIVVVKVVVMVMAVVGYLFVSRKVMEVMELVVVELGWWWWC